MVTSYSANNPGALSNQPTREFRILDLGYGNMVASMKARMRNLQLKFNLKVMAEMRPTRR
jgi:hypothetical protein